MSQLSLFSAQARIASADDLAGLLCARGQVHGFGRGTAARVSVVVADQWRAVEIARACQYRRLPIEWGRVEHGRRDGPDRDRTSDKDGAREQAERAERSKAPEAQEAPEVPEVAEQRYFVRTTFVAGLRALATAWTQGAVKAVPEHWQLDGAALRFWVLAAGAPDPRGGRGYLLGLDPQAPQTHAPLAAALAAAGLARAGQAGERLLTYPDGRGAAPALRVTGPRRLARLAELVGEPPPLAPTGVWPG